MTTLVINLPSNPGCPPLSCGVGNSVFLPLITASVDKSADGSGYIKALITAATQISVTSWNYTVTIEDSELAAEESITLADITGQVCCISCADAAILTKVNAITPDTSTPLSWQTFSLAQPGNGIVTSNLYLYRRATAHRIHAIEIARHSGSGTVSVRLRKTGSNLNTYTGLHTALAISNPNYTARRQFTPPLVIGSREAVDVSVIGGADIYAATSFGLELNLITSEIP
jgi:hypothetical protein